eukprot:403353164
MQKIQVNYSTITDVDEIFDSLINYRFEDKQNNKDVEQQLPDDLIKKLYFMQSDYELFIENLNKADQANSFIMSQLSDLKIENQKLKDAIKEKDTEIRIMKRERDEQFTNKMEVSIENKRLKAELENMRKQIQNLQQQNHQQEERLNSQSDEVQSTQSSVSPNDANINSQLPPPTQRNEGVGKLFKGLLFGHSTTKKSTQDVRVPQPSNQQQQQRKAIVIDEQYENEQKLVIQSMQDQIITKITEIKGLQGQIETLNQEVGKVKGNLAQFKEKCEDLGTDIEIYQAKLKKSDEMLTQKDKEIISLKIELQKMKSTLEKEIKKLKKAQDAKTNVGGPSQINTEGNSNKNTNMMNQTFDPYGTGGMTNTKYNNNNSNTSKVLASLPDQRPSMPIGMGKQKVDLNHTYIDTYDNVFAQDLNDEEDAKNQGGNSGKLNKSGMFKDDFFSRGMQRLRLNTQKSQIYGKTMNMLGLNKDSNSGNSNVQQSKEKNLNPYQQ